MVCGATDAGCRGGGGTGPERPGGSKVGGMFLRASVVGVEGGEVIRLTDEGVGEEGTEGGVLIPGTTSG